MRQHLFWISGVMGLLVACSSIPTETPLQVSLIDEFLERSYLRQEILQASEQMINQQATKSPRMGSEGETKALALNREMEEALRPESTLPLMKAYLRTQPVETLLQVLGWLRTPLAERMLALAAQPFDYGGFNTYQVLHDELRYELIPRLDKAMHTSELAIKETTERTKMFLPILAGKEEAAQFDGKLSPTIEQFVRAQSMWKLSFIYRTASGQDLQRYVEFLESPLGQTYVVVRQNALVAAYSKVQTVLAKLPALARSVDSEAKPSVPPYSDYRHKSPNSY